MQDYNQDTQFTDFENPKPQRPIALTVFCILSFINAVYQFIVGISTFLTFDMLKEMLNSEDILDMMEKLGIDMETNAGAMEAIFSVNRIYYLLTALLYIGSFIGVLYMWKLQKRGFHFYAIAQILILTVTALFVTRVTGAPIWADVIYTAIFIFLYFSYYKRNMQ